MQAVQAGGTHHQSLHVAAGQLLAVAAPRPAGRQAKRAGLQGRRWGRAGGGAGQLGEGSDSAQQAWGPLAAALSGGAACKRSQHSSPAHAHLRLRLAPPLLHALQQGLPLLLHVLHAAGLPRRRIHLLSARRLRQQAAQLRPGRRLEEQFSVAADARRGGLLPALAGRLAGALAGRLASRAAAAQLGGRGGGGAGAGAVGGLGG